MIIAAIGDIHSNDIALRACLQRAERLGAERFIFVGDYVSDCACPQYTMAMLRRWADKYPCHFTKGNREQYMLNRRAGQSDWCEGTGGGSLLYTYRRLTEDDLNWFERMPDVSRYEVMGFPAIMCCHGTPDDLRGWAAEDIGRVNRWLHEYDCGVYLCAHTHRPQVTSVENGLFINTGSCGVSLTAGQAQFALLAGENGTWRGETVWVSYDVEAAIARFDEDGFTTEAGLWPAMMKQTLRQGGEQAIPFLARAREIWNQPGPIPEAAWRKAAIELGFITDNE